ncbi:MAG: diguanylate cyclase [Porticoccaceae bacterium]
MPPEPTDSLLETLAAMFRAMALYPLVDATGSATFYGDHEDWALHFLNGTPPPGLAASTTALPRTGDAQLFFRERRLAEQSHVQHRAREYSALVRDLLETLRDANAAAGASASSVDASLQRIQKLLTTNAVDQLRAEFAGMAAQLRQSIAAQQATLERQLGELRQRVEAAERARERIEVEARALGGSVADLRQALADARAQMQLDPLTQLYNRGAFDAALLRYTDLALASGQMLALILLDLDHFKTINDRYGHPGGDKVLSAFSDLLSRTFLRADDFVARYGGEEFAVLLSVNDAAQVERLVEALFVRLRELRLPFLTEETVLTCSGGYALLRANGDGGALIERADRALYRAKRDGRDRLCAAD